MVPNLLLLALVGEKIKDALVSLRANGFGSFFNSLFQLLIEDSED